jgi:hypothetical protein
MDASNRSLLNVLAEIARLCDHLEATGAAKDVRETLVSRFNQALSALVASGDVEGGMFHAFTADASLGQISVDARLLAAAARQESGSSELDLNSLVELAPFVRGEDLAKLLHAYIESGRVLPTSMLSGLAPFLRSEDLTELLRRSMDEQKEELPVDDKRAAAERLLRLHSEHLD